MCSCIVPISKMRELSHSCFNKCWENAFVIMLNPVLGDVPREFWMLTGFFPRGGYAGAIGGGIMGSRPSYSSEWTLSRTLNLLHLPKQFEMESNPAKLIIMQVKVCFLPTFKIVSISGNCKNVLSCKTYV